MGERFKITSVEEYVSFEISALAVLCDVWFDFVRELGGYLSLTTIIYNKSTLKSDDLVVGMDI